MSLQIRTFQTGRQYTPEGQRIAWVEIAVFPSRQNSAIHTSVVSIGERHLFNRGTR